MPPRLRGSTAAAAEACFIPNHKSPHQMPLVPIDLPDDFTTDDDRASYPLTLLTGLGIGIMIGLAWGQVWAMIGGAP